MESIIIERKKQFNTLIDQYIRVFKKVRLEYNLEKLSRDQDIMQIKSLENQIENTYIQLLKDVDVDINDEVDIDKGDDVHATLESTLTKYDELQERGVHNSHVHNGALERLRITKYRYYREQIFIVIHVLSILLFLYVYLRDISQVDHLLFQNNIDLSKNPVKTPSE